MAHAASTHARTPGSDKTHLELHDRLADHREQPRRQRDQLRRERCVRPTGGDCRRRLPVPREQHRHEQLEPLQPHIWSFVHARSSRQEQGARCVLPRVCTPSTPVAVYHTLRCEYP
jgi:hypothetical protein